MSTGTPFDPRTMPLDGLRLIEASAGTGKTFSLAGLYLRLLVEQRLTVREILVMTFTRAATQELRERIRARLVAAARIATDPAIANPEHPEDALTLDILAASDEERPALARRLRDAAARMDEATISTIHGFAQQAAADNAFDGGLPFDRGEQVDDTALFRETAADYWRSQTIGEPAARANAFLQLWGSPEALFDALRPALQQPHVTLAGPDTATIQARTDDLRQRWQTEGDALRELLLQAEAEDALLKSGDLHKAVEAHGGMDAVLTLLDHGIAGTAVGYAALPGWLADFGDAAGVRRHIKKAPADKWCQPHTLPLTGELAALQPLGRLAALRDALETVRTESLRRKRDRRQFSFADMIEALHDAITDPDGGDHLAAALHETWPWALVDEFQDTDPLQYAILQRIYRGRDRGGLLMIGDPKQAIYAFRGGDVFAYLDAARDADGCYHLDTNFRSTGDVLRAVQTVFETPGDDAFLIPGIRFQAVEAGRRDGDRVISVHGDPLPAMTVWPFDASSDNKGDTEAALLEAAVTRIHALLDTPATVTTDSGDAAPVRPRDIAVLVNTNQQATAAQQALSRRGIAAVCLHQASVFTSDEALDVLRVLQAAATPADESSLRAALTTPLFGYVLGELIALTEDESAWQTVVERFQAAHERWHRHGVLAMLQPLLQAAAPRLLTLDDGERRMTNYLQLGELLQNAAGETFGMNGLIQWLDDARNNPERSETGEAEQLRLESDDALVRIATVHKVKGLQYRIVFLPFAPFLGATGNPDKPPRSFHDDQHRACLDYGVADAAGRAIRERRAEAIRLLYVALTRAEQACYLPWGAATGVENGALAWLLHGPDGAAPDQWSRARKAPDWVGAETVQSRLGELAGRAGGAIAVEPLPEPMPAGQRLPLPPPPEGGPRRDAIMPRPDWSVYSFSRLVSGSRHTTNTAGADDETPDPERPQPAPRRIELRGPQFGTAIHDMLEAMDFAAWPQPDDAAVSAHHDWMAGHLRNAGVALPQRPAPLLDAIGGMLSHTAHAPLPGTGPLAAIPDTQQRREMEFFLGLSGSRVAAVIDRLTAAGYATALPADRRAQTLRGLMHGFIDLIVAVDGRYYIIDYKTNDLGAEAGAYQPDGLQTAVRHGHYDLQYLIYTLALHRHLARSLPGYDPAEHLGGVHYLFVRGMTGEDAAGVFTDHPPADLILALDRLFAGEEAA